MDPAPPFEVVETATGRLYRLPPRQLGPLRALAVFPLLVAIGAGAFLVRYYLTRAAKGPLDEWAWATFIFTGLGWTRAGYYLVSLAAAMWCGRTEIEVAENGKVWATDRVGWLRVRVGKLKPGTVRKLVLAELAPLNDASGKPIERPLVLWNLSAETDRGKKVRLAVAHPREVLTQFADELAGRLALAGYVPQTDPDTGEPLSTAPTALVPIVVEIEKPEIPIRDVLDQPVKSRIVLERHPDGLTLTVPPRGICRANFPLILAGTGFSFIGGMLTFALIGPIVLANARPVGGEPVGPVFLLVGLGLLLGAYHSGRKRAVLAVVGDRLLTLETGPLGSRRREFVRTQLLDVACGPSNVKVNGKILPQLRFVPFGGTAPVGMLTGRDETELMWLATVLRQALGISSVPPEFRALVPASEPRK